MPIRKPLGRKHVRRIFTPETGTVLLLAGIHLLDLATPRGWSIWLLYFLPILVASARLPTKWMTVLPAVSTVLIATAFFFKPEGAAPGMVAANRAAGIALLWLISLILRQRNRAEEGLRGAREEIAAKERSTAGVLQAFYDSAPMMMGLVAVRGDDILHLSDNAATGAFFGVAPEAMRNAWASGRGTPREVLDRWVAGYRQAGEAGRPVRFEYPHECDGETVWLAVTVSPLGRGKDGFPRFSYIAEDVTVRRRMEEELARHRQHLEELVEERSFELREAKHRVEELLRQEREARQKAEEGARTLEALMEHVPEGLAIADASLRFRMISRSMAEMAGRPAAVLAEPPVGEHSASWGICAADCDTPATPDQHPLYRAIRYGETIRDREMLLRRPDGRVLHILSTASPIRDRAGKVAGGVVAWRDVTERRKLEEQLRHSQRLESVGRLAGGVAHEFNNLMTVVNGYAEMLLSQLPEASRGHREAEQIRRAGVRAASLTRQLLAFGRKQVMQVRIVDLGETVAGMSRMLQRLVGEHIRIETESARGLWKVKADPGQLEQVIVNLAVNARDAMPQGGRLSIRLENSFVEGDKADSLELVPGPFVLLSVIDTGHGMDEATVSRIFEPFFTTKEVGQGSGLGLAMAYGIVRQSNGHIQVESAPGKGTAFRIRLPRAAEEEVAAAEAFEREAAAGGRESILVVEDEGAVRELVRKVLEDQGYRVDEAASGEEAIARGCEGEFDLVLSDVLMPGMGGAALAAAFAERCPKARILLMPAYTRDSVAREGRLPEGLPFIQKPFTATELARKVREILDDRPGQTRKAG